MEGECKGAAEAEQELKIGTWNTHRVKDAETLLTKMKVEEFDIVTLQEIMLNEAQIAYFSQVAETLDFKVYTSKPQKRPDGSVVNGMATVVRKGILTERILIEDIDEQMALFIKVQRRNAEAFLIGNLHVPSAWNDGNKSELVRRITSYTVARKCDAILLGDWNMEPDDMAITPHLISGKLVYHDDENEKEDVEET